MAELLAPAGSMPALKAAISNGCDAVYLGMRKFGARAYSDNFDIESLAEAVRYAHIRDVKIYVTMNTIIFEDELSDMHKMLHAINELGVDGVIVQDLAVFKYIVENFEDMQAHCSTQMGIDDLEGTLLFKELGAKRVVLAREVPIDEVKRIRKIAKIPIEIFIHGALCVSYSGNCLMSGLIGYRSGNRGRCVGSCRKPYELVDSSTGKTFGTRYYLSMKDLNTIDRINDLKDIDSLKIEGRMKEPVYVANVVSKYRATLDGTASKIDKDNLKKTFNRTFTRGYIFGEDKKDIANTDRPNNFGYVAGRIVGVSKGKYEIKLVDTLNQNDIIRIDHGGVDVNLSVVKLYDRSGRLIDSADKTCFIKVKEELSDGDIVYKTKDVRYYKELEANLIKEYRHFPLDMKVYAYPDSPLVIDAAGLGCQYIYESEEPLSEALKNPTSYEQVKKQLSKLGDTVFEARSIEFEECNAFIPVKILNEARRNIVEALYDLKMKSKRKRLKIDAEISEACGEESSASEKKLEACSEKSEACSERDVSCGEKSGAQCCGRRAMPYITASVMNKEQYDACKRAGIDVIYFKNIIRRNQNDYADAEGELLIGGYGGIYHYRHTNPFVTDYSMNVVNSESYRMLHKLGAKRVTLSYEINKRQLKNLIDAYIAKYDAYPSLEMVVYGRAPLMFTKYCPLKTINLCGECRKGMFELRDEYGSFPIISHDDCTTTILNGKILNLLDEMKNIDGVEAFRLNFTVESAEETEKIAGAAIKKLNSEDDGGQILFDRKTDTRGHFNKEII